MNEFSPLRSSSEDEWELAVLASARSDAAPEGARARVAVALGVSATLVASSATVAAASSASSAAVAGVAAPGLSAASGAGAAAAAASASVGTGAALAVSGLGTWAGVGVLAGLVTSVAAHTLSRAALSESFEGSRPAIVVSAPPAFGTRELPPRRVEPELAPMPDLPELAGAEPRERALPSESALPAPSSSGAFPVESRRPRAAHVAVPATHAEPLPADSSPLAQEVGSLDEVRHALDAGNGREALAAADRYRARFPHGALAAEAAVLRVKALLASRDRSGAEREAEAILRATPQSRYAERVRALLGRERHE